MASRLLVDNDVLIKLAHWGLLDPLPACFNLDWQHVTALTSLKFRARRGDTKLFKTPAVAARLAEQLENTAEVTAGDPADLSKLQGIVDLDAGEVELVAACLADPDALLISGDKRALIALANACPPGVAARLSGRVICLEQLLTLIARETSETFVIDGVLKHRELDSALRSVVGPTGCSAVTFLEGMDSYVSHLRGNTSELLRTE